MNPYGTRNCTVLCKWNFYVHRNRILLWLWALEQAFCTNQYVFLTWGCLVIYCNIHEFDKISNPIKSVALGINNSHQPVFVRIQYKTYVEVLKDRKCLMKSNFIHTKPSVIFRNWKNQKCLPFYKVAKQATMH